MSIKEKSVETGNIQISGIEELIFNNIRYRNNQFKAKIPTNDILDNVYNSNLPGSNISFEEYVDGLQERAKTAIATVNKYMEQQGIQKVIAVPSKRDFASSNGRWAEYGFAVWAWNVLVEINKDNLKNGKEDVYIYVKLPNTSDINSWINLLSGNMAEEYKKFLTKISRISGKKFEHHASNPDAVILRFNKDDLKNNDNYYQPFDNLNKHTIKTLDGLFKELNNKSTLNNIHCFISVKYSIRLDRLYQWVHEGTNVKEVLQWIERLESHLDSNRNPNIKDVKTISLENRFYTVCFLGTTTPQKAALNTGMLSATILEKGEDGISKGVWAVDKHYDCLKFSDVETMIKEIVNY